MSGYSQSMSTLAGRARGKKAAVDRRMHTKRSQQGSRRGLAYRTYLSWSRRRCCCLPALRVPGMRAGTRPSVDSSATAAAAAAGLRPPPLPPQLAHTPCSTALQRVCAGLTCMLCIGNTHPSNFHTARKAKMLAMKVARVAEVAIALLKSSLRLLVHGFRLRDGRRCVPGSGDGRRHGRPWGCKGACATAPAEEPLRIWTGGELHGSFLDLRRQGTAGGQGRRASASWEDCCARLVLLQRRCVGGWECRTGRQARRRARAWQGWEMEGHGRGQRGGATAC